MDFLFFLLSCFYFFLPAYFTNMAPPLIRRARVFKFLAKPCDFGRKFKGQPILGRNKSCRGAIFGIIIGILVSGFQFWLYQFSFIKEISLFDYREINIFLFGLLISSGAVFGDLLFAFIKRRLKMEPGQRFLPFDQTNYVIGAFLFLAPYFLACPYVKNFGVEVWITIFILTFFLHTIGNRIGYLLGLHRAKW